MWIDNIWCKVHGISSYNYGFILYAMYISIGTCRFVFIFGRNLIYMSFSCSSNIYMLKKVESCRDIYLLFGGLRLIQASQL
jgi:hypothetical protein